MVMMLQLINWEEGNYRVTDKPLPRGEIIIGGGNVASCYYKLPGKTEEEFFEDSEGRRWFRTGDIGEFDADGVLKIIDRKKDLVKLQHGEYVSYGKTESVLKTSPIVENICAYADPARDHIIAIVIPDKNQLAKINPEISVQEACHDAEVKKEVVNMLKSYGMKNGLKAFEVPGKVLIVLDEWTPDNGLVTAAFKIRRNFIYNEYREEINNTYNES